MQENRLRMCTALALGWFLVLTLVGCGDGTPRPEGSNLNGEAGASQSDRSSTEPLVPRRPPRAEGLDPDLLDQAFAEAARFPRIQSLLVARNGTLLREAYFNGGGPQRIANIKSASKSVLSTLVGIAIQEGHLTGLDQRVLPFFPELEGVNPDPRLQTLTVGHLLSMQAGLQSTSSGNYGAWAASSNWVRDALRRPFVADPGTQMVYSTGNSHVLSAILTRATGQSTLAFARRALFAPLGITLGPWTRDPQGVYLGGNEMGLRAREMFRFGELHRLGGTLEGQTIISSEWIDDAWTQRGTSRFNGHGHGLGWWIRNYAGYEVRFAWGHGGQYVFIVPDLGLTVVTTSIPEGGRGSAPTRAIHDLLERVIIPAALQSEAQRASADDGAPVA